MKKAMFLTGRAAQKRAFNHCLQNNQCYVVTSYLNSYGDRQYADPCYVGDRDSVPKIRKIGVGHRYRVIVTPKWRC